MKHASLETLRQRSVLTFDVYGTLIDWETGLNQALQAVFSVHSLHLGEDEALELFAVHEAKVGAGDYLPYRDVLAETLRRMATQLEFSPTESQVRGFADSVRDWPAFSDSREALQRLRSRYRLAVITNCDDEHFSASNKQLNIDFDYIVTAELARSYKPSLNNFRLALGSIGEPQRNILHVAESLYHDHVPAKKLGLATAWIHRRHGKPGSGATPSATATPDVEFPDMKSFADAMLGED